MNFTKKLTLVSLSLASFSLFAFPKTSHAFELKEYWMFKGGIQYKNGKVNKINNGYPVDIQVLDLPNSEVIEWSVSLNGENQNQNFLATEQMHSTTHEKGRFLNFYIPYGYHGTVTVEAKSAKEVQTWSTTVVNDLYSDTVKRGYFILQENQVLSSTWDAIHKTYTATLPSTTSGKTVTAWLEQEDDSLKLHKPGTITHRYDESGMFVQLQPVFESSSWLQSENNWYYQRQGDLAHNEWISDNGTWYFMNPDGTMFNKTWLYYGNNWYAFKKSGAMLSKSWLYDQNAWYYLKESGAMAHDQWIKDQGNWYYLDSSGKMLSNTWTPDGYYVGKTGAWE